MLSMLQLLGMSASFSRPRVSDDNPYSESLFRTVKYCALFPAKPFESLEAARGWVTGFVGWYNTKHLHSAIRFVTPDQRHFGLEAALLEKRIVVYEAARRQIQRKKEKRFTDSKATTTLTLTEMVILPFLRRPGDPYRVTSAEVFKHRVGDEIISYCWGVGPRGQRGRGRVGTVSRSCNLDHLPRSAGVGVTV